ncbi:unnamed protein product [Arabidopsis halleri]
MRYWLVKLVKRRVDPTLDMEADQGDDYTHLMDHGIQRDGNIDIVESQNDQFRRSLLQDFNLSCYLSKADGETTKDANQERLERMSKSAEMEDLQAPQNFPLAPFSIKGNVLNESRRAGALKRNVHEAYGLLKESVLEIRITGLSDPLIKPEVSIEFINTIITVKNPRESSKDEVLHHWTSVKELLRLFWSSYPITTPYLHTKIPGVSEERFKLTLHQKQVLMQVGRLQKDAVSNTYSQLEATKESVQSDLRHQVSLLVRPMQQVSFFWYLVKEFRVEF